MIKVGQKVRFNPFKDIRQYGLASVNDVVTGKVHYVHPTHRWFNVEYGDDMGTRLISFKFDDIGKNVRLVEG